MDHKFSQQRIHSIILSALCCSMISCSKSKATPDTNNNQPVDPIIPVTDTSNPPEPESYPYQIGLANTHLELPEGVPLGGFGGMDRRKFWGIYPWATLFKPSEGQYDPIRSKVMMLHRDDKYMVFISLDTVIVQTHFAHDIWEGVKQLGIKEDEIIVSATHSHSGPGAIDNNKFAEYVATDIFKEELYKNVIRQMVGDVQRAYDNLEDAALYKLTFDAQGLQINRRGHPGHFDSNANLLIARNRHGDWLGGLINFAIHGTAFGLSNLKLSSDVIGGIERYMEANLQVKNSHSALAPTMVFFNGAEGDVRPSQGKQAGIDFIGKSFTQQFLTVFAKMKIFNATWNIIPRVVKIATPTYNATKCVDYSWLPDALLPIGDYVPDDHTYLRAIQFGDLAILAWPGEPTTSSGQLGRDAALAAGASESWVFGLTHDYQGYFVTPDEYDEGGYEACSALLGKNGAVKIAAQFADMLKDVNFSPAKP